MISLDEGVKSQDPQPQEPQPKLAATQEPKPSTGGASPETSAPPQVPAPLPPQAPSSEPPADFDEKIARLMKARADALTKGLVDDRGRVLREPLSPDEAMRNAIEYLPRYLQSDSGPDSVRTFMSGGKQPYSVNGTPGTLPNGWVPSTGVVKSTETQELEWRAKIGRDEANPIYLAARDYVIDPVSNIGAAALQVPTDIVVSGFRHVGALPPDARLDIKEFAYRKGGTTAEELAAIEAAKALPAKAVGGAGTFAGTALGFTAGIPGKVLGTVGKGAGAAGKALFGKVVGTTAAQTIGYGAGVFGAYEGLTAKPGEVLESTAKGVAAGAVLGVLQKGVSLGLRKLFATPIAELGTDEKGVMDALKKWATENKVFAAKGESATAFDKRVVDTWIDAGLPGAPAMPMRKLFAAAARGGADAFGFSLLDQQFRQDLYDAAWHGDTSKWNSVVEKFSGNFLGAAALHMPLSSIVPWQRRQSFGKARGVDVTEAKVVDIAVEKPTSQPKESTDAQFQVQPKEPLALPAPQETRAEKLSKEQDAKVQAEYTARWDTLFGDAQTQSHWENTMGASLDNVIPLGWRPSEKTVRERPEGEPATTHAKIELPQSGHSFTIDGEVGRPSPAMREALDLPAEMPAKLLVEAAEKASLVSALHTKSQIPGEEISIGIKAVPGRGEEPGKMFRTVMGEVQQSDLRTDPKWEKVDAVPARGKDAIEPEQHDAVELLRALSQTREDISPPDRSLLHGATEVLDTVAASNDPAVAETLAAFPKLGEAIQKGEPGAIKALAESLTTKMPEKALADADRVAESKALTKQIREQQRQQKVTTKPASETLPTEKPNPESGHLDFTPAPGSPADKALQAAEATAIAAKDAVEAGAKTGGNLIGRAWNAFQQSTIQRVEDMGRRAEAEIGRDATTATKRIQTQVDTAGLTDMRRMSRSQLDSVSRPEDRVSDDIGGSASVYARAMDAGMAKHFGAVEKLTPEQQAVVDHGRAVTQEIGKIAEEVGVEQTDSSGKNPRPFKFDPEKKILVREPTPILNEARRTQRGPVFDAMIYWLSKKYGWTPEEATKQFSDARGLTSLDATEIRRTLPVVPEFLDVPGEGTVRLYEARPLEHAEKMAFRSSQVLGARSVLPRFSAEAPAEGAKTFPSPPGLDPLPPTAQQFVDKVLNDTKGGGPDAAKAVADMVRAMHGLPLKETPRMFRPGEVGYHTARVVDRLLGVVKSGALSMSAPMNLAEPLTNTAHFGTAAIGAGYKETVRAIGTGEFAAKHRELVEKGFLADTKLNDPWHGDTTVETVENSLKKAGEILTTPIRVTQDINEMVNAIAAEIRLTEMKAGNGIKADDSALSLLGFDQPTIDAMKRGEGTPAQYERYQRNIVGELAGGKSQRAAQKSAAGNSPLFNSLVWFTNFFQARSRVMTRLARDIGGAQGHDAQLAAVGQLTKFLVATGLGGLAGNVARQFLTGGPAGVEDYLREQKSGDWWDVTKNIAGLISSGVVGGVGQPVADAFGEAGELRDRLGKSMVRLVGPLDTVLKLAEGKGSQLLPAAKAVNEGLFGMSALAISDKNIDLDNAQDSYYRWIREHRPTEFGKDKGTEEQQQFREAMRAVVSRIDAGKDWGDESLVNAVIDAEAVRLRNARQTRQQKTEQGQRPKPEDLYNEAKNAVAESLRSRKILPKPGEFTTAEVQSLEQHLGEKNLQTLRDYDAVIELMAKRVHRASFRGAVQAK